VAAESIPRGQSQRPSAEILAHVLAAMEAGQSAAQALREVKVWRAEFWRWINTKATPSQRQRYKNAVAARAHAMIDETIDLADSATTRDEALRAKIQIDARWQAASKYDPQNFGDYQPRSGSIRNGKVVLIDDAMLKRIQDCHEEKLLNAAQKPKVGRPSRARGHIC
jgi:terminase small subunit-like protein